MTQLANRERKVQDDKKAKNILISGLSSNEFFHTTRCNSAKGDMENA